MEQETITIQKEIAAFEDALKEMKRDFPEVHSTTVTSKEECIQKHREGSSPLWRRIQPVDLSNSLHWFEELREVTTERFEQERPLRSVIKRMSVIDENIIL